jgi:uncharacterized protein (TIGR02145 family)
MRSLLRSTLVLSVLLNGAVGRTQQVSDVTVEQQGQVLEIRYALEANGPMEVKLFVSTDHGKSWQGPLTNCTGDVGKNVSAGADKRIRWAVLEDRELVGDGIRFKVLANIEKPWLNPTMVYGSVTDIDGNTYATIQIGKQVWMAENLRTTRFRDGSIIPNVKDGMLWSKLSTGAWCNFDNDTGHDATYGKLYNWNAVADGRNLCPAGWHVPKDAEWTALTNYLGGSDVAGGKLKATTLWNAPNTGADNGVGFSGLPGGYRLNYNGSFGNLGLNGYWWSASASSAAFAWYRYLSVKLAGIDGNSNYKSHGMCVRCVRD